MPLSKVSPDQLLSLIQGIAAVTWASDPDGSVREMPQWTDLTGQNEQEIAGEGWLQALHPDDRDRASAAWRTAVAHGQVYNTDYRVRCVDGVYRWFNARGVPIRAADGFIERWVGVCLEIPGGWRFRSSSSRTTLASPASLHPAIVRAARAMLSWSAEELSNRSDVSISTIRRLEHADNAAQLRRSTAERLTAAFAKQGLIFVEEEGEVVGLRWSNRTEV